MAVILASSKLASLRAVVEEWRCLGRVDPGRSSPARKMAWTEYGAGVLRPFAQPSLYPFAAPELAQAVAARMDPEPDLIHVQQLYAMLPLLRLRRPLRNVLFDIDDVAYRDLVRRLLEPPLRAGSPPGSSPSSGAEFPTHT